MVSASDADAILDAAIGYHQAGQLDLAETAYRSVLRQNADDAEALNLLGVLLQDRGATDEALSCLEHAVQLDPEYPEALTNLARVHRALGAPQAALPLAERASQLDETLAEAFFQLGMALLDLRRVDDALPPLQKAISISPGLMEAHLAIGNIHMEKRQDAAAAKSFSAVLAINPNRVEARVNLGASLMHLGQIDEAFRHQELAASLAPTDPIPAAAIAQSLRHLGRIEQSVEACNRALRLNPEYCDVWVLLGTNQVSLGQFDEAEKSFHHALSFNPESGGAQAGLASIGRALGTDDEIEQLRSKLLDPSASDYERVSAGFALGGLLDKSHRFDEAFSAFKAANGVALAARAKRGSTQNLDDLDKHIAWVRATFTPALFEETRGWGNPSERPVFIVGMPRSGTTLMEQIAASHPRVFGMGEQKKVGAALRILNGGDVHHSPLQWNRDRIQEVTQSLLGDMGIAPADALRVIDKLPDNILALGQIGVLFPNARIVIARRDLRDIALSCYFQNFADSMDWSFDLEACGRRAAQIESLISFWRSVLPTQILEVQYENLVEDMEPESRRMIEFLGLDWDPACLDFHKLDRAVLTASQWQVRQPLYATSVGRWRHYQAHIDPLLKGVDRAQPHEPSRRPAEDLLQEALAAHQQGRSVEAQRICDRLLKTVPDNAAGFCLLGLIALSQGNTDSALQALARSAALAKSSKVLIDVATGFRAAGQPEQAVATGRRALVINPEAFEAHLLIGMSLLDLGRSREALDPLQQATKLAPGVLQNWIAFASALTLEKQYPDAERAWHEALRLAPGRADICSSLGVVLSELGRAQEALHYHLAAAKDAPRDAQVQIRLAKAHLAVEDAASGLAASQFALTLAPDSPEILIFLGTCLSALGQFDEAKKYYRQALRFAPQAEGALVGLVDAGDTLDRTNEIPRLQSVMNAQDRGLLERAIVGFALVKHFDRTRDYDRAFACAGVSNGLMKDFLQTQGNAYDHEQFEALIETSIHRFTRNHVAQAGRLGSDSDQPVFVVGLPRSGTTLVEQILASHPHVVGFGETNAVEEMIQHLDATAAKFGSSDWLPSTITTSSATRLREMRTLAGGALRIVDKMPDNLLLLGQISILFPAAKIILCRRDLRDVGLSCFFQHFGDGMAWSFDLQHIAKRAVATEVLTRHWKATIGNPLLEVSYEELVSDIASGSRRLIDFLGLEWDPACLEFHKTKRQVLTSSNWQVRQPVYTKSVGRWRHYQQHLAPLIDGLGALVSKGGQTSD